VGRSWTIPRRTEAFSPALGQTSGCAQKQVLVSPANQQSPLGAAMFSELAWGQIARNLKLSGQELQVVRGVFDDLTEGAIADHLKVSPHTIHTHTERLYRKLGVTGRVKLALRVMDEYVALTLASGTILPPLCAKFTAGRCPLRGK